MMVAPSSPPPKPKRCVTKKLCLVLVLLILIITIFRGEGQLFLLLPTLDLPSDVGDSGIVEQSRFPLPPRDLVVAYAVSITHCHEDLFIADAAAVLQHSIQLVHQQSRYAYKMIAFVHPDAQNCTVPLDQLGYQILVKPTPVQPSEMQNLDLRHEATTTGCCGEKEFLKLYSLTLTEHAIVVHLDLDCLLLQPLDPLYDAMMLPDSQSYYEKVYGNDNTTANTIPTIRKYTPDAMWSDYKSIPITSYFVRDYNMVKGPEYIPPNRVNMQGGFWIIKPNPAVFDEFCDILRHGHGYSVDHGWGDRNALAPSHKYGVAQIQGLVSYYYAFVRPWSSVELNQCYYDSMVTNPAQRAPCHNVSTRTVGGVCQDCRQTPLERVRSIHFTLCLKPWWCPVWIQESLCSQFHYEWHRIREDFERSIRQPKFAQKIKYVNTSDMTSVLLRFRRHCRRPGSRGYRPINTTLFASYQRAMMMQTEEVTEDGVSNNG